MAPDDVEVRAAGGVVWRERDGRIELLLVHRARYDDWTFPKGKLDAGESWEDAAAREVEEETAHGVELGDELASTDYRDHKGRTKRVRYWTMTVDRPGTFEANDEITDVRWVALDDVAGWLSYERDQPVLHSFTRWREGRRARR